tara:strand:+ start:129 stop:584 length:456 start_codon:yes stop_codon:yes gene_type:complete
MMSEDEKWMQYAIKEAKFASNAGEIPVGAILVLNNEIISRAHNNPIVLNDPTAHAEILALRHASKMKKNYRLPETTLYVTLEPCLMCLGALIHARIKRVVFGASDSKLGVCGSSIDLASMLSFNHKIIIEGGILENECKTIIQSFFKKRRK